MKTKNSLLLKSLQNLDDMSYEFRIKIRLASLFLEVLIDIRDIIFKRFGGNLSLMED